MYQHQQSQHQTPPNNGSMDETNFSPACPHSSFPLNDNDVNYGRGTSSLNSAQGMTSPSGGSARKRKRSNKNNNPNSWSSPESTSFLPLPILQQPNNTWFQEPYNESFLYPLPLLMNPFLNRNTLSSVVPHNQENAQNSPSIEIETPTSFPNFTSPDQSISIAQDDDVYNNSFLLSPYLVPNQAHTSMESPLSTDFSLDQNTQEQMQQLLQQPMQEKMQQPMQQQMQQPMKQPLKQPMKQPMKQQQTKQKGKEKQQRKKKKKKKRQQQQQTIPDQIDSTQYQKKGKKVEHNAKKNHTSQSTRTNEQTPIVNVEDPKSSKHKPTPTETCTEIVLRENPTLFPDHKKKLDNHQCEITHTSARDAIREFVDNYNPKQMHTAIVVRGEDALAISGTRKGPRLAATILSEVQAPDLPSGWVIQTKRRNTGRTAGSTDNYWFSPVHKKKFRSMVEVNLFLKILGSPEARGDEIKAHQLFRNALKARSRKA